MRKPSYWLAAALLCSATMVVVPSCKDDDDDNNGSSSQTTTVSKPVKGTDFDVNVEGNTVTITTKLTYGNMYVLLDGVQKQIKDGKAVVNIPVSGEYKMTFNIYENGINTASDEFTVKIEATDLSFLDKGVFKALTGGKEVYEAATADENGYKFTRSWRLDAFISEIGSEYTKSGYVGGVGFFGGKTSDGDAWWACAGSYKGSWQNDAANGIVDAGEDATIAFDPVNNVVKFTVKTAYDTTYVYGMKSSEGKYTDGILAAGTYYTKFTYTEKTEQYGADNDVASLLANNARTTVSDSYLEIKFDKTKIGENGFVRMPLNKIYAGWTSIFENQYLNFLLMTDETQNVLHTVIGRSVDGGKTDASTEGDNCLLFYTYVSDELDAANAYTYEIPSYSVDDVVASDVTLADIQGAWSIDPKNSPFGWINWASKKTFNAWADFETACNTVKGWWAFGDPDGDEASIKYEQTINSYEKISIKFNADGSFEIVDPLFEFVGDKFESKTYTGNYTFENGYITFSTDVTIHCASVSLSGNKFYVVKPEGSEDGDGANDQYVNGGLWIGVTNGDKSETAAIHFAKGL
ncbi:MAG: hypothetical protein IKQ46_11335 [Bacteroidales bacterium]|nr:hypothetical protein [Bacteroidales bacterium]